MRAEPAHSSKEQLIMTSKRPVIRIRADLARAVAIVVLLSIPAAAQNQAESLSASFRKAAQRVAPSLVGVRPLGVSRPLVTVPIPNVGPFRPTDFIPRGVLRNSNEVEGDTIGSGFIVDADRGIVVTTEGVLRGSSQAVVVFSDGTERVASQIRRDLRSDVAILVVDLKGQGASAASWGDSNALEPGDWVLALGSAAGSPPSMSAGIYSARRRGIGPAAGLEWLETDVRIGPVYWGGPIVNLKGEVVGMSGTLPNSAPLPSGSHYILPAGRIRRIAADLAEFGQVRRGYLGVQVEPLEILGRAPGAPGGVVISSVGAGTPAAAAGLRPGDRILSANGRRLISLGQLQAVVEETPIGEELTLLVDRNGGRMEVKLRPQAQPGPAEAAGVSRSRIEGAGSREPGQERVRSRVVPARPAHAPANPSSSSDPTSLEPVPGVDHPPAQPAPSPPSPGPQGNAR
jgi:serine protease Do